MCHLSYVQLPALQRLDLVLNLADDVLPPQTAAALGRLSELASMTALSLHASPTPGLLRHLRLPPDIKAGLPSKAFLNKADSK